MEEEYLEIKLGEEKEEKPTEEKPFPKLTPTFEKVKYVMEKLGLDKLLIEKKLAENKLGKLKVKEFEGTLTPEEKTELETVEKRLPVLIGEIEAKKKKIQELEKVLGK